MADTQQTTPKLTHGQRAALLWLPADGSRAQRTAIYQQGGLRRMPGAPNIMPLHALRRMQLVDYVGAPGNDVWRLTDTGKALRQSICQESGA